MDPQEQLKSWLERKGKGIVPGFAEELLCSQQHQLFQRGVASAGPGGLQPLNCQDVKTQFSLCSKQGKMGILKAGFSLCSFLW